MKKKNEMKLKRKMLSKMFKHHIAICVLLFMEKAYEVIYASYIE